MEEFIPQKLISQKLLSQDLIVQKLTSHLQALGGPRDPFLASGSHQLAQYYICAELKKWGEVTAERFELRGRDYFNWQTMIVGRNPKLAPFLVGAHYDTVPGSPGADDNASGVAALLLLVELLSIQQPRRSVYFVAFDLEEYGLVGSLTCAEAWRSRSQPIHLMLSLEMLGYFTQAAGSQQYPLDALGKLYPDTGNFIALIGNAKTILQMRRLKKNLKAAGAPCQWLPVINQGKQIPPTRNSDHAPFWDAGYSAMMVTDTAHLRNPHYHTATDTISTLNIEMMAKITQGLAAYLLQG